MKKDEVKEEEDYLRGRSQRGGRRCKRTKSMRRKMMKEDEVEVEGDDERGQS